MDKTRMERICALLCLLSTLELRADDPKPMSRRTVRRMLEIGALSGCSLKEANGIPGHTYLRAQKLLERADAVCRRLESYAAQGYQVLLEGDALWPRGLEKLSEDMPLYLFAKGSLNLAAGRLISVAGSRAVSAQTSRSASALGRILARQEVTVVSGGAKGVDSAAVNAALRAGGNAVVIPAVSAQEFFSLPQNKAACEAGRLLLLCETPPDEPFSAGKALTRNHSIYALGDVAMVVASRRGIGGSWSGAMACLKNGWSPLYMLDESGREFEGNRALIKMGAMRMQIVSDNGQEELLMQGMDAAMVHKALRSAAAQEPRAKLMRLEIKLDSIPRSETLRYLGWKGQAIDDTVAAQLKAAEKTALEIIHPSVVVGEFMLCDGNRLSGTNFIPRGEAVSLLLDGCQRAVLMAASLGAQSERALLRAQAFDPVQAAILDAVLSAAIEAVADRASEAIAVRARQRENETTGRFSPGYGDMPMEQTREICDVLSASSQIGLTVSQMGLMMPRKSVCAIIGEGSAVGRNTRSGCAFCPRQATCLSRKSGKCTCMPAEE